MLNLFEVLNDTIKWYTALYEEDIKSCLCTWQDDIKIVLVNKQAWRDLALLQIKNDSSDIN